MFISTKQTKEGFAIDAFSFPLTVSFSLMVLSFINLAF